MLEIRPSCEHCNTALPYDATDAMICSYECTYCRACAQGLFENVCPNCGGGLVPRPVRPKAGLASNPPSKKVVFDPKNLAELAEKINELKNIPPHKR